MIQDVSCIDYNRELILQECDEAVFEPYVDPKSGKTCLLYTSPSPRDDR